MLSNNISRGEDSFVSHAEILGRKCKSLWRVWEVYTADRRTLKEQGRWLYILRGEDEKMTGLYKGELTELEAP